MNFQQLRSVRETVRCGFNLTEVAAMLYTSQLGVVTEALAHYQQLVTLPPPSHVKAWRRHCPARRTARSEALP